MSSPAPPGSAASSPSVTSSRRPLAATLSLVAVCAVWGSTFTIVKNAIERMPVLDFLTWRFAIATLALVVVRPAALRGLGRSGLLAGVALGGALGVGYVTQTYGLRTTPASISGFITGMFVVFTPLVAGFIVRRPIQLAAWAAVGLATVGLGLITLHGFAAGSGEALTLICAFCFALHIVGLGEWSASYDAVALAVVQLGTVTAICAAASAHETLRPPPDAGVWWAILVTALLASAAAFFVQTWAQAHLTPVRAAVVLTMEPVFAGIVGVTFGHDHLGWRQVLGAGCVLAAMVLVEAGPRHGAEATVERLEA